MITAVGKDRPGIIAALSSTVYSLGANLDDATMTRLHGAFATMLAVSLPDDVSVETLRSAFSELVQTTDLTVTVEAAPGDSTATTLPDHIITVYGADKPGIVFRIADALGKLGVNITDMDTRVAGTDDAPIYIMLVEVASGNMDLPHELESVRTELGLDLTVHPLENETL